MADGVWKGVQPKVFGRSRQLLLNKFFDPSTPSMRNIDVGEKEKKRKNKIKLSSAKLSRVKFGCNKVTVEVIF